jgi:transposase
MDAAVGGDAAAVRAADRAGRYRQEPDGVEEPPRQRSRRQHCDPVGAATIEHFTHQFEAVDRAIGETIKQDAELRGRRELLLSVIGVGETLAALLLAEMPEPEVLRRSGEMVAYAGLNPSHHRSGTSIDRPTRISKIGNATPRSSLSMPALSAMRYDPAVAALVARLKQAGRLTPKQVAHGLQPGQQPLPAIGIVLKGPGLPSVRACLRCLSCSLHPRCPWTRRFQL